jgi:dTMP kinase
MLPARPMPFVRYPLESLARVREEQVDAASRELAAAARRAEAAASARLAAQRSLDEDARVAAGVRDGERAALAQGGLRAADLARAGEWSRAVEIGREQQRRALEQAAEADVRARQDEEAARARVAARQAEAEVVARHRGRWEEERRAEAEACEEEAAAEAWRARG